MMEAARASKTLVATTLHGTTVKTSDHTRLLEILRPKHLLNRSEGEVFNDTVSLLYSVGGR
jgi:hypothetical protein